METMEEGLSKFKNEYFTYYIDFDFKVDFCIFAVRVFLKNTCCHIHHVYVMY